MKVLYVDISIQGHRIPYLRAFESLKDVQVEKFCLLPENKELFCMKCFEIKSGFDKKRNIDTYIGFIKEIRRIVHEHNIDVVHFLCGDALYRFFGIGLGLINAKIVITYHHMVFSKMKSVAIRNLFRHSLCGVVHTENLQKRLIDMGIKNVKCIFYPMFDSISEKTSGIAKQYFGLKEDKVVLGVIGATERYKGLDVLIQSLNQVKYPCILFIAGKEGYFKKEYIEHELCNELVDVRLVFKRLSDEEFADAIQASDVIMLPYRKEFDGASGPLVSAVVHKKPIIAANHGSLGDMVERYKLGMCFESENEECLTEVLNQYLGGEKKMECMFEVFQTKISVENFLADNVATYS